MPPGVQRAEVPEVGPPDILSTVPGMAQVRVGFDNWSHSSGNRRAFTTCKRHKQCRKWVYIKDFPSPEHACAYLLAWQSDASLFPFETMAQSHIAHIPSDQLVKHCLETQFRRGGRASNPRLVRQH